MAPPDGSGRPDLTDVAEERVENRPPPNVVSDGEPDPVDPGTPRRYLTVPVDADLAVGNLLQVAEVDGDLVAVEATDFADDTELAAAVAAIPTDAAAGTPSLRRLGTSAGQALAGTQKGAAGGVAPLDGSQKLPLANLPTVPIASLEEPVVSLSEAGELTLTAGASDALPLKVIQHASQTTDPFTIFASNGTTKKAWITSDNKLRLGDTAGTNAATDNPTSQSESVLRASRTDTGHIFHADVSTGYYHANHLGFGAVGDGSSTPVYIAVEDSSDLDWNLKMSVDRSSGYGRAHASSQTGNVPFLYLSATGDVWIRPGTTTSETAQASSQRVRMLADYMTFGSWDGATEWARVDSTGLGIGVTASVPLHVSRASTGTILQLDSNGQSGRYVISDTGIATVGTSGSGNQAPWFQTANNSLSCYMRVYAGSTSNGYNIIQGLGTATPFLQITSTDDIWVRPGTSSSTTESAAKFRVLAQEGLTVEKWDGTGTVFAAEPGGATPKLGFFGTAAIAKPTGVAVDAAGIHAALVSLGLIAA